MAKKTPEQRQMEAQDRKFQAEHDARILGDAEAVKADPVRMRRAQPEIRKMQKEAEAKARGLKKAVRPVKKVAQRRSKKKRG